MKYLFLLALLVSSVAHASDIWLFSSTFTDEHCHKMAMTTSEEYLFSETQKIFQHCTYEVVGKRNFVHLTKCDGYMEFHTKSRQACELLALAATGQVQQ